MIVHQKQPDAKQFMIKKKIIVKYGFSQFKYKDYKSNKETTTSITNPTTVIATINV